MGYRHGFRWSEITKEQLLELYAKHGTWYRVEQALNAGAIEGASVRRRREFGLSLPQGKHPRDRCQKRPSRLDDKVDEIRRFAALGWSCSMIAAAIGEPNEEHVRRRMVREGIPRRPEGAMPGELNHCWKGGRRADKDGYVLVRAPDGHSGAMANGYIREHRLIAEAKLGRRLRPEEVVHHIDGNKANNLPENLQVFPNNGEHLAHEWSDPKWAEHQSLVRRQVIEAEENLLATESDVP